MSEAEKEKNYQEWRKNLVEDWERKTGSSPSFSYSLEQAQEVFGLGKKEHNFKKWLENLIK